MDIEEAKEQLLKHKKEIDEKYISARYSKAIEVVLSELDKKDKIIDKLITEITAVNSGRYEYMDNDRVLEIFTNKVEEDK